MSLRDMTIAAAGVAVGAVLAFVGIDGKGNEPPPPPQILEVAPPLATALDICLDPASTFAHIKQDDHYEGQLVQNAGQLNQVRYHLFFRDNLALDIVIEETRAGQAAVVRTDPNTQQFLTCVAGKDVEEVNQTQ